MTQENLQYKVPLIAKSLNLTQSQPIEIAYEVSITAKVNKQTKTILQNQRGLIPARSFTAILGPSGCGKTTLLNFLSGRLMSNNLTITGQYKLNSISLISVEPFCNQIGYVMQQDALLATLTPKQCLLFAAHLRLPRNTEKQLLVQNLLDQLGLMDCCDVKIGNNFIKGISGGERKRTSIGVELITNPSLIFLDEPTTGLDSTTALQVILLLKKLSSKGKTVISTIHQPSSELFYQFDRLMLLVDGKCIFHGPAPQAQHHFAKMNHQCPQLMNASQFYLDLMSLQVQDTNQQKYLQLKAQHDAQIDKFQKAYLESQYINIKPDQTLYPVVPQLTSQVSFFYKCGLIWERSLICVMRNPMDVGFKIIQSIFTSLILFVVFGRVNSKTDSEEQKTRIIQNLRGIIFFLVSTNAFGGIQGTLATFAEEKPVFLRERFSKSYSTFAYFISRTGCNFPFQLIYPTVGLSIVYWATGLGDQTFDQFIKMVYMVNCVYFLAASYGLFYAALIPKLQTAMALVPLLIIPFMLLGGFFINLDEYKDIRVIFYPIMYLSPFKYGFQAGMESINDIPNAKYIPDTLQYNLYVMIGMGLGLRLLASIGMQWISNPKRPRIKKNV